MLILKEFIGQGAVRECYRHPQNKNKCVKILKNSNDLKILKRELEIFLAVKNDLGKFILNYDDKLVMTNKGFGLVCELLTDDDGTLSKPVYHYFNNGKVYAELQRQFYYFIYQLIEHNLYFYDFNLDNFIIQKQNQSLNLKYIDLKSFENNKSWTFLKLEKIISPLAEAIMKRRLKNC